MTQPLNSILLEMKISFQREVSGRGLSEGTRSLSHSCVSLTAHCAATTHLEIIEFILHDCQFILKQLSCIFFVLESLH